MTRFVTSPDGTRIATHDLGDPDGPPVLIAHGFATSTKGNWLDAGWGRAFERAGLHGIAMDLRGHGESERRPSDAHVPRFLEDAIAVLDDRDLERVGFLGYSMGARMGWRLGAALPDRFSALVLGGLPAHDPFQWLDRDAASTQLRGGARATGPTAGMMRLILSGEGDPEALLEVAAQIGRAAFNPELAAPEMPVLLATGTDDEVAADTEELLQYAPQATFVPLPGRTHVNAITSGVFRREACEFLLRHADRDES